MVTTKLIGRLGNQAFQIAACIGYALKHGMDYSIPSHTENPKVWPAYFKYHDFPNGNYTLPNYNEPCHEYREIPYRQDICLSGYFQSEKYFEHCKEEIVDLFAMSRIKLKGTTAIHVRRGDYVQLQNKHPLLGPSYYSGAIKHIYENGGTQFLVFSDDVNYCKEVFKNEDSILKIDFCEEQNPLKALDIMQACENQIIANSSFSWWGAYLNRNPEKIVIAPATWFGPGNAHLNTKDLIPAQWKKM